MFQLQSILMGWLNSQGEQALDHLVLVGTPLEDLAIMDPIADIKALLVPSCILIKILKTSQQEEEVRHGLHQEPVPANNQHPASFWLTSANVTKLSVISCTNFPLVKSALNY